NCGSWVLLRRLLAARRPAARVGRIDKAMQPRMRGLIRRSVIFFENIDDNHRLLFVAPTPPAMVEFGRFGTLADGRPLRAGGPACALRKSVISWGYMVYNCRSCFACQTRRRSSNLATSASCRIAANCLPQAGR